MQVITDGSTQSEIAPNNVLRFYQPKLQNRKQITILQICDKELINVLRTLYNIHPRKTYISNFEFPHIPEEFERDFIRGFIDGDGWVYDHYRCDSHGHRYEIGFCSTSLEIIKSINSYILDNFNIEMLVSEQKGLYTSKICSKYKVFKILNRIYYDNCLALNRKNKTAQKIRKDIYNELF